MLLALGHPPLESTSFTHSHVYRVLQLAVGLSYHFTWFSDATPLICRRDIRLSPTRPSLLHSWQSPSFFSFLVASPGEYRDSSPSHVTSNCHTFYWSACISRLRSPIPPLGNPPHSLIHLFIGSHSWASTPHVIPRDLQTPHFLLVDNICSSSTRSPSFLSCRVSW